MPKIINGKNLKLNNVECNIRRRRKLNMKLGKDEIGPLYIIGLILVSLSSLIASYGFFFDFWLLILGIPFLSAGFIVCRIDILDHRKPKKELIDKDNSILSHDQIRHSILTILYKKAETNPKDNIIKREQVIELLNVPENIVDFDTKYLEQENLIKIESTMDKLWLWAEITSSGINIIEHKDENKQRFPFLNATIPIQIQTKIGIINL